MSVDIDEVLEDTRDDWPCAEALLAQWVGMAPAVVAEGDK